MSGRDRGNRGRGDRGGPEGRGRGGGDRGGGRGRGDGNFGDRGRGSGAPRGDRGGGRGRGRDDGPVEVYSSVLRSGARELSLILQFQNF